MYAYEDRFQTAFELREEKRRRLTRTVRGWLRSERSPRLATLGILAGCALSSVLIDLWLRHLGFEFRPYRWSTAVIAAWPVFLLLMRWRAGIEAARCDLGSSWDIFIHSDDAAEQLLANDYRPPRRQSAWEEAVWRETGRGVGKALGQGGGGMLYVVFLVAITGGLWLAWDLIRRGPGLLADTVIDGVLVPERPQMAASMACGSWQKNLASSTFAHFAGMALMAIVAAIFWPPDFKFPL